MKKTLLLVAAAITAAFVFAGCEKEVGNRVPATDSGDSEFTSKGGVQVVNRSTNHGESRFNYDNWREQTTIDIYDKNKKECDEINLPWAKVTSSSMPIEYKHPEREFLPDGSPRWELAFNFCDWETIPGIDMFGLWDDHNQLMRIYTYIEELPNQNAKTCYYEVHSTANNYIDPNTRGWMPTDWSILNSKWSYSMGDGLPVPTRDYGELLPITGTLEGQVNPGWICFELNFNSGISEIKESDSITFTLLGAEQITFTGSMDIKGSLECNNGTITIPGNKTKVASGFLGAFGSLFSGISSAVSGAAKIEGPESWVAGTLGIGGAVLSCVGNCLNAAMDGEDKDYKVNMNFNISATAEINGSLTTNLGTTVNAIQIDYDVLFGNILAHQTKASAGDNTITTGLWNLKNPPVIYIAEDAMFEHPDKVTGIGLQAFPYHPSFLDPMSIELMVNTDNVLFPLDEIKKFNLLAYDFVFVSDKYDVPAQPYYDYYDVPQDSFLLSKQKTNVISCDYHICMLDPNVDAETISFKRNNDKYDRIYYYSGVAETYSEYGLDAYNLIGTPIIHQIPDVFGISYTFDQLGVAAVLEVEYKNGDKRIFSDRFLPRIKAFSINDADSLKTVLSNASQVQTIAGIPIENPLFEAQKAKAVRVLDSLDRQQL